MKINGHCDYVFVWTNPSTNKQCHYTREFLTTEEAAAFLNGMQMAGAVDAVISKAVPHGLTIRKSLVNF